MDHTYIAELVAPYLQALRASAFNAGLDYDYDLEYGQRYIKVISHHTDGSGRSVHAFIERSSGDLIKAASWKAPQRNSDGSLAVRYHLADPVESEALFESIRSNPQAFAGGYLYAR